MIWLEHHLSELTIDKAAVSSHVLIRYRIRRTSIALSLLNKKGLFAMHFAKSLTLLSIFFISACEGAVGGKGSPVWHMTATPEEKREAYTQLCVDYGFERGTTAIAQCRMQVSQESRSSARRRVNDVEEALRPRPQVTCQRVGNITTCS